MQQVQEKYRYVVTKQVCQNHFDTKTYSLVVLFETITSKLNCKP